MTKQFAKDAFAWGFGLWLVGYALGIALFPVVSTAAIGWVIAPIGVALTLWVLLEKVHGDSFGYYLQLAIVWVALAVACDYVFLVKMFKPADGYYKLDVYLYYVLTLALPLLVGLRRR